MVLPVIGQTAVLFREQTTQISSRLPPRWGCRAKRIKLTTIHAYTKQPKKKANQSIFSFAIYRV